MQHDILPIYRFFIRFFRAFCFTTPQSDIGVGLLFKQQTLDPFLSLGCDHRLLKLYYIFLELSRLAILGQLGNTMNKFLAPERIFLIIGTLILKCGRYHLFYLSAERRQLHLSQQNLFIDQLLHHERLINQWLMRISLEVFRTS